MRSIVSLARSLLLCTKGHRFKSHSDLFLRTAAKHHNVGAQSPCFGIMELMCMLNSEGEKFGRASTGLTQRVFSIQKREPHCEGESLIHR